MTDRSSCTAPRLCETCGATLQRRHDNESVARFARRRYCSNSCAVLARPPRKPSARTGTGFFRDDFLHEVWFGRCWLGWPDQRIAAWLGLTVEAFEGRLLRALEVGETADEDRWEAA